MQTFFAGEVTVVGHRGWPTRYPDNTNAGIRAGLAAVGAVEVDVRRSGDGCLVLSHDPVLGGLVVSAAHRDELARVDLGSGQRPVLLADLLADRPPGRLDFEVKNLPGEPGFEPDHGLALDTAELARPGDLVTSFHWPSVAAVRRAFPGVETGLLLPPGMPADEAVAVAAADGHRAILARWETVADDPGVVRRAESAGVAVAVWTVDDAVVGRRLVEAGVRGIITNDPGGMAAGLDGGDR